VLLSRAQHQGFWRQRAQRFTDGTNSSCCVHRTGKAPGIEGGGALGRAACGLGRGRSTRRGSVTSCPPLHDLPVLQAQPTAGNSSAVEGRGQGTNLWSSRHLQHSTCRAGIISTSSHQRTSAPARASAGRRWPPDGGDLSGRVCLVPSPCHTGRALAAPGGHSRSLGSR
jgi:hypothetical protein